MANRNNDLGSMIINVSVDDAGVGNTLDNIKRQMKQAQSAMKAQISVMNSVNDRAGALNARLSGLNNMYELQGQELQELRRRHEQAVATYGEHSEQAQRLGTRINRVVGQMADYQRSIQRTEREINDLTDATQELGNEVQQTGKKLDKFKARLDDFADRSAGFSKACGVMVGSIGLVGGAILKVGSDFDSAYAKIENSMSGTKEEIQNAQETAKKVFADGWGESLEEVTDGLIQVKQNIRDLNDADLQKVTSNAMAMAQTWNADVNEVTRATNNIMQNFGISAEEAMDLLAQGGKKGLNFSNELFDNMSEYAPLWSKMGFSAEEMFSRLSSGVDKGIYNLDYANDLMKEFGIRTKDGSKTTADAMGQLSGATQKVWKDFLAGKGTVKDVNDSVLKELKGMGDQVLANQIGIGLYGTKFEDLEADAVYALGNVENSFKDVDGTADKVAKTIDKTFSQEMKELIRSYATELEPFARELLTVAKDALPAIKDGIESVSDKLEALILWYKGLSDGSKSAIKYTALFGAGLLALGAILSPVVIAIGGIVSGIGGAIGAFKKFFGMFKKSSANINAETSALNRNTRAHQRNNSARGGVVQGASSRNRNLQGAPRTGTIGDYHGSSSSRGGRLGKLGKLGGGLAIAGGLAYGGMEIYDRVKSGESTGKAVTKGVTTGVGATGGALIGGALGSLIPIPVVGTMLGSMAGSYVGSKLAGTATKDGGLIDKIFSSKALNVFKSDSKKINDEVAKLKKPIVMDYKIRGVSAEIAKTLKEYDKLNAGVKQKLNSLYMSQTVISDKQKSKLISNQRKITESVLASVDKREKDEINSIKKSSIFSEKEKAKEIARVKEKYAKKRNATNNGETKINAIISKANKENRALTRAEYEKINAINKQMNDRKISATSRGEKESTKIKRAQKNNRVGIGMQELKVTREQANKQFDAVVSRAKKTREKKIAEIKYQRDVVGSISAKEADKLIKEAKRSEKRTVQSAKDKRDKIVATSKSEENKLAIVARRTRQDQIDEAERTKKGVGSWWSKLKNFLQDTWNSVRKFFGFKPIMTDKQRGDTSARPSNDKIGSSGGGGRVPQFAKGTINGSHKGGMALVNDGAGQNYQELIATPNGNMFVPQQRNVMLDLPKGSAVLEGNKTAQLLKQYNFPMYAKGTNDDNLFAKGINFGKKMWKGLENVTDKAKNLADAGVGKIWDMFKGNLSGFGGLNPKNTFFNKSDIYGLIKNTTKGGISKLLEAFNSFREEEEESLDWHWDGEFEKNPNAVGAGAGRSGLMKYVDDILRDLQSKFKIGSFGGYVNRGKVGGKGKSMHAFGRAIDIFASFPEMQKIANYVKKHPLSQYTIFNNKVSTKGGSWANYGATKANGKSPHTDHVHADFIVPKLGSSSGGGSIAGNVTGGVRAWIPQIKKAYKATYGKNISTNGLNEVLEQIQTESSGNALARQGIIDINSINGSGGAKGLLQFIQSTFNNYKQRGHGNIWSGYDQLMALFNVREWYSAITRAGRGKGWSPRGGRVHPYANGGIITSPRLGLVGEDGAESVIPLSAKRRTRALSLLHETAQRLGVSVSEKQQQTTVVQNNNDEIVRLLMEQNALLMQQNKLIKEKQLNIGDEQIYNSNKRALEKKNRRDGYSRGL